MNPFYSGTPKTSVATLSTANSTLDGTTGTFATLVTGVATGSVVLGCVFKAIQATSAGMIRLFVDNTTTKFLLDEIEVPESGPSSTVKSLKLVWVPDFTLILPSTSYILKATTENAESFRVITGYGDY